MYRPLLQNCIPNNCKIITVVLYGKTGNKLGLCPICTTSISAMQHNKCDLAEEVDWLRTASDGLYEQEATNVSWAGSNASNVHSEKRKPCLTSLLLISSEDSKSPTMVKHGIDVARKAVNLLNPN